MLIEQIISSLKFDWQVCMCVCVWGGGGRVRGGGARERECESAVIHSDR